MCRVVVLGAVIILISISLSSGTCADEWHSFHRDIKNTGVAESEGPLSNFVSWVAYLPNYGSGSSAYENGVIFLPSGRFGLRAVNATTGEVLWTTPSSGNVYSNPTYHNGTVYFGAIWGNGTFYAVDASDGSYVWTQIVGEVYTAGPVVAEDMVFVTLAHRGTIALNANNGSVIWNESGPGYMHSTPAYENGTLFCGGFYMQALNVTDGSIIWKSPIAGSHSGIVIAEDKVCGHDEDYVTCLNKKNGTLLWQSKINTKISWNAIESTPAVYGDRLYVGSQDGRAFAFNLQNGSEMWNVSLGEWRNGSIISSPIVAPNDVVYFANDYIWALNATTGETIWSLLADATHSYPVITTPMLVNKILYFHDAVRLVAVGDLVPPMVSDATLNGHQTLLTRPGETVRIEALVSDLQTGGHDVVSASLGTSPSSGSLQDFHPEDGAFDSPSERVYFELDTTGMDDGSYGFEFETCDSLMNCGHNATETTLLIIDGTPPNIDDLVASPGEFVLGGTTNIAWNTSDSNGVENSRIEIFDVNLTTVYDDMKEGEGPHLAIFMPPRSGEFSVRITSTDLAGNSAEKTIIVSVLNPPKPDVPVTEPIELWVVIALLTIFLLVIFVIMFLLIWHGRKKKPQEVGEPPPDSGEWAKR